MLRWDGRQAQFDRISESHGIVSRPFGGNLMEDGRGRIWTQMYVYDPATDRLDELTAADGANLGTGWFLSRAKTTDGRMLFGGSKGILVVSPERFDASTYAPPLLISELVINGQRESAGGIDVYKRQVHSRATWRSSIRRRARCCYSISRRTSPTTAPCPVWSRRRAAECGSDGRPASICMMSLADGWCSACGTTCASVGAWLATR